MEMRAVAKIKDLQPGAKKEIELDGESVLLVSAEGGFYAVGSRCTHLNMPLAQGILKGNTITCAYHASQFDLTNGEVLKGPAKKPLPAYEVRVEGEDILIGSKNQ